MAKEDMYNLVRQSLKATGERMIEISKGLGEGGDRLSSHDRKLCRMAMIPALEESFSELIHFYMLGIPEAQSEAFGQLDRLLGLKF